MFWDRYSPPTSYYIFILHIMAGELTCSMCKSIYIGEGVAGIECTQCQKWTHKACLPNMSDVHFKSMHNMYFLCQACTCTTDATQYDVLSALNRWVGIPHCWLTLYHVVFANCSSMYNCWQRIDMYLCLANIHNRTSFNVCSSSTFWLYWL